MRQDLLTCSNCGTQYDRLGWHSCPVDLGKLRAENQQLRKIIEEAPHTPACIQTRQPVVTVCDCWKSKVPSKT